MNKKAMALAVGALFAAPAAQAQIAFGNETIGTVQFYGKLYPQVIYAKSSDATQPGTAVSTLVATSGTLGGDRAHRDSRRTHRRRLPELLPRLPRRAKPSARPA